MLCLVGAGERCPSHYLGLRQATAIRPDRLIVPAGDSHLDGSTLSALADAGAVSADWLLLLCLWRGRQGSADDPLQKRGLGTSAPLWQRLRATEEASTCEA